MAKFKIEDSVRVIKVTQTDIDFGINLNSIGIVKEILNDHSCIIELLGKYFYMTNDQLEKNIFRNDAVDTLNYAIQNSMVDFNQIKEKEKNNMEIVDLYEKRMKLKMRTEYEEKKEKIQNEDYIQTYLSEKKEELCDILKNNFEMNIEEIYQIQSKIDSITTLTNETQEEINKLYNDLQKQIEQLNQNIIEVKAMLSMTNDYSEQVKILKNYGIIDKKTNKLNA